CTRTITKKNKFMHKGSTKLLGIQTLVSALLTFVSKRLNRLPLQATLYALILLHRLQHLHRLHRHVLTALLFLQQAVVTNRQLLRIILLRILTFSLLLILAVLSEEKTVAAKEEEELEAAKLEQRWLTILLLPCRAHCLKKHSVSTHHILSTTAKKMRQVITSYILPILLLLAVQTHSHNVTLLLANHPSLSSFNHFLTQTHLAEEINQRNTITVCAVDNGAMYDLTSKGYTISTLKNILSLHVLLDYFDAQKLHKLPDGSALTTTLFQATGAAPENTGFVKITNMRGGNVRFDSGDISSSYVKSIEAVPYDISIIQISSLLLLDTASAPTPAPTEKSFTEIMSAHG
ncbi:unnamed protein product, partial [Brassica oleracea var. botrytis]